MTAQIHEIIIVDGEQFSMNICPTLPEKTPVIRVLSDEEVENALESKEIDSIIFSTACWRQYQGVWEIKNSMLYLNELKGRFKTVSDEPLFAEWFTGTLTVPEGEILQYMHMGFSTVYEKEIHYKIENGVVTGRKEIDNRD